MQDSLRQNLVNEKTIYISCIVPVFNEEAVLEEFLVQLEKFLLGITHQYEIIVVDDGSHDATATITRELIQLSPIKLIALSRNFGKEIALSAGIEHCSGDVAILIDADFQHPFEVIPTFLASWAQGYDMVYGIRNNRVAETWLKRQFANLFYWLMKKMTHIEIPTDAGDFRLLDKSIVKALKQFPERTRFMKGLYAWVGFKKKGIYFDVNNRVKGKSHWHFTKLTELAITGITSFSDVPLRIWGFIGFLISTLSLMYAIYIVTVTLIYGADLPGFPSLIVAIMFLGGIQLLSIGILGEYIARIFTEVKQRPIYLIQSSHGFDD